MRSKKKRTAQPEAEPELGSGTELTPAQAPAQTEPSTAGKPVDSERRRNRTQISTEKRERRDRADSGTNRNRQSKHSSREGGRRPNTAAAEERIAAKREDSNSNSTAAAQDRPVESRGLRGNGSPGTAKKEKRKSKNCPKAAPKSLSPTSPASQAPSPSVRLPGGVGLEPHPTQIELPSPTVETEPPAKKDRKRKKKGKGGAAGALGAKGHNPSR